MQLHSAIRFGLVALAIPYTCASSGWGFTDATVSVQQKGAGVGSGIKEKLSENKPLSNAVPLSASGTLKLLLTTQEDHSAQRPHQAFLLLKDTDTGLDISYPLSTKNSGKAKVELPYNDIPIQFLKSTNPIQANLVIASFGSTKGYNKPVFQLSIDRDLDEPLPEEDILRYGKLEGIHHTFKEDPQSPPTIVSLVFVAAVLATLPALSGVWLYLGANFNHLSTAMSSSPLSHILFAGSIVGLEVIFFLYYTSWNLFQTLPAVLAMGTVTVVSGSRALGEVQVRRLAGLR